MGDYAMDITTLFIQLISGVAGSSIVASGLKHLSLGRVGNVVVGLVGGSLGGQILGSALGTARMTASAGLDPGIIVSEIAGSGLGGAVMLVIVGTLQRVLAK
jgi:uncharacterized membrane protein YeaQ/YmgE (transglycosylase-associated protein family)